MKLKPNWSRWLEQGIEAVYLLIVFLVPLIFALVFPNANVFELNKIVYFRVLLTALAFLTLGHYLLIGTLRRDFKQKHYLAALVFLVFPLLTLLWSLDWRLSFFGLYDRQEGALSYLLLGLWFLLMIYNLGYGDLKRKLKTLIVVIVLSATLVSLYAWIQMMALDPIAWSEPAFLTNRATSTLGQPNYLASFLLFTCPLVVYLLTTVSKKNWLLKIGWALVLIIQLGAIYFTFSRGAWLALLVILIISLVGWFRKLKKKKHITAKQIYGGGIVLIILLAIISILIVRSENAISQRIKSAFDLQGGSVGPRITFWKDSVKSIYQKPLQGYGLETQELVLIKYYQPDWGINGYVNARTNRAHNVILDITLAGGLLWLAGFIWLLWEFGKLSNRLRAKNRQVVYWQLALVGYLVSLLFSFSFVAGQVYFWLYLAVFVALAETKGIEHRRCLLQSFSRTWRLILWLILLPFLYLAIKIQLAALTADHYFLELRQHFYNGQYVEAAKDYEVIKFLPILQPEYYAGRYVGLWYDAVFSGTVAKLDPAIVEQLQGLSFNNGDYASDLSQAKLQALLGNYDQSKEIWKRVVRYTPSLPENYLFLARFDLYQNQLDSAIAYLEEAKRLVPNQSDPRLNGLHQSDVSHYLAGIEYALGEIYQRQGRFEVARQHYQTSLRDFYDLRLYKKIADTYYLEKNFDRALWYNERAMYLDKNNYIWPLAISYIYRDLGDQVKFQQYQAKAKALQNNK